jgi:hypothetical protein
LARVFSRLAGRLLTGPLAFAVALVVDLLTFAIQSLIHRVNRDQ